MNLPAITPRSGPLLTFTFEAEYQSGERREFPILAKDWHCAWLEAVNSIVCTGRVRTITLPAATPP